MPLYLFRCRECGREQELGGRTPPKCQCGSVCRRVFCVNVQRAFTGHFNHAVGQYVGSDREFRDALKRRGEENSMRTGTDHNYQPVDIADMKAVGATDEGLEHTKKVRRDTGLDSSPTTTVHAL